MAGLRRECIKEEYEGPLHSVCMLFLTFDVSISACSMSSLDMTAYCHIYRTRRKLHLNQNVVNHCIEIGVDDADLSFVEYVVHEVVVVGSNLFEFGH